MIRDLDGRRPCPFHAPAEGDADLRGLKETVMINFRLIGAAALSLILADPAMAASGSGYGMHRVHHEQYGRELHRMPAQDFDHFVFGIAHPTYHSGWGGPYGDGDYPGTVDQNMGPPYWQPPHE